MTSFIIRNVSRPAGPVFTRDFEVEKAAARAKIAAHHFYRATPESQVFVRLLTGLRARGIVREPEG